jgi:ankyrin repeat protein
LGKLALVQLLLSRDDVEKSPLDESGNTPLLLAAQRDHASTVDLLLSQPDTHVGHANQQRKTALTLAVEFGASANCMQVTCLEN